MFTIKDLQLLGKKILVGILVFLVPAFIIVGGLLLTQKVLSNKSQLNPQTSDNYGTKN